jgi:hypothetical protein
MKSKLLGFAFLVAMTGVASAAKVNWEGALQVTAISPSATCIAGDIPFADHYLVAYSPKGLGTNSATDSFLGTFRQRSATSYRVVGLPTTGVSYTGTQVGGRGTSSSWIGQFISFSSTPAVVTTATQVVVINARISNFQGVTGCTATVQGAFVLRRD